MTTNAYSVMLWSLYHGYKYELVDSSILQTNGLIDRHAAWNKIVCTRQIMEQHSDIEWVFYIDSDAIVRDFQWNIAELLDELNLWDDCLYDGSLGGDVHFLGNTDTRDKIHAGLFLMRRTPTSRNILETWWNTCYDPGCDLGWNKTREQLTLGEMVWPQYPNNFLVFHEYQYWTSPHGLKVRHYWTQPGVEELRYSEIHRVASLWAYKSLSWLM